MTHESKDIADLCDTREGGGFLQEWLTPQRKKILLIGGAVILFFLSLELFVEESVTTVANPEAEKPKMDDMGFASANSMTDHRKADPSIRAAALVEKDLRKANQDAESQAQDPRSRKAKPNKDGVLDRIEGRVLGDIVVEPVPSKDGDVGLEAISAKQDIISDADPEHRKEMQRQKIEDSLLSKIKSREGLDLSHEELVERLVRGGLGSSDDIRVLESGIILRKIVLPEDARTLTQILRQQRLHVEGRKFLIEILGQLGDRRSFLTLEEEFHSPLSEQKLPVVEALGYLKDERAIPLLVGVVRGGNSKERRKLSRGVESRRIQQSAIVALSRIGGSKAEYALTTDLSEDYGLLQTTKWAVAHMKGKVNLETVHTTMPPGRKHLVLQYKGTEYHLYHPVLRRRNQFRPRLLVCIPDDDFNAQMLLLQCKKVAENHRIGVIVPVFDPVLFPNYGRLNYRSSDHRPDKRLLELLDLVSEHANIDTREIYMIGVGHGGSFVLNFAMAYPNRVARYVSIAAPEPFFPKDDVLYPEGLKVNPLIPDVKPDLRSFLKTDGLVIDMRTKLTDSVGERMFDAFYLRALEDGITPRLFFKSAVVSRSTYGDWVTLLKPYLFPKHLSKSIDDL